MKLKSLRTLVILYLGSSVIIHIALFWTIRKLIAEGFPDLAIYYCTGTIVRQGMGHQLYDPAARFEVEQQFAKYVPQFNGPLPYTHPPFEALLYIPISYLPWIPAYIIWNVFNVGLLVTMPLLLRSHLPGIAHYPIWMWWLAMFAFFPIAYELVNGQDSILVLFFYTLAYVFMRNERFTAAGASLGLGLFKFHMIAPFVLLWLLDRRKPGQRTKLLLGFIPVGFLLVLASVAIAGFQSLVTYPKYVFFWEDLMAGRDNMPAGMPTLRGLLFMLSPKGFHYDGLLLVVSIALITFVAWSCRLSDTARFPDIGFVVGLLSTVVLSYHAVSYDLSVLILAVALLVNYFVEGNYSRQLPAQLITLSMAILYVPALQISISKHYGLMVIVLLVWLFATTSELMRLSSERLGSPRKVLVSG